MYGHHYYTGTCEVSKRGRGTGSGVFLIMTLLAILPICRTNLCFHPHVSIEAQLMKYVLFVLYEIVKLTFPTSNKQTLSHDIIIKVVALTGAWLPWIQSFA